jgi:hypothetical protein
MTLSNLVEKCRTRLLPKVVSCATLVALSDNIWLAHGAGWASAVLNLLILIAVALHNHKLASTIISKALVGALFGLAVLPVWDAGSLGYWLFAFLLITLVLLPRLTVANDAARIIRDTSTFALSCFPRTIGDAIGWLAARRRKRSRPQRWIAIGLLSILPVTLTICFVALFSAGNPLIGAYLDAIDWLAPFRIISGWRLVFWSLTGMAFWSVIRPRYRQRLPTPAQAFAAAGRASLMAMLFDRRSVMISLIIFNGLFLIENVLDAVFLWSGQTLPEGVSYAGYVHQGVYPLMATILLAIWFVLTVLKPGSSLECSPVLRRAVYLWLAQNIFLTASSILRMLNYVAEYSLTYSRVAVLVWTGLVSIGLVLIVLRILMSRSNRWLINANALSLGITLYVLCFTDVGGIIAQYNVEHCAEVTGKGATLDLFYLERIGPDSLPALSWLDTHQTIAIHLDTSYATEQVRERLNEELSDPYRWTLHRAQLAASLGERP